MERRERDPDFAAEAERARREGRPAEAERLARVGLGRCPDSLRGRVVLALALLDQGRPDEARDALLPVADVALCGTRAHGFPPPPPPVPHEPVEAADWDGAADLDRVFEGARAEVTPTSADAVARAAAAAVMEVDGPEAPAAPARASREEVIATLERWLAHLRRRTA